MAKKKIKKIVSLFLILLTIVLITLKFPIAIKHHEANKNTIKNIAEQDLLNIKSISVEKQSQIISKTESDIAKIKLLPDNNPPGIKEVALTILSKSMSDDEKLFEYIYLADAYPNHEVLQFLAATHCEDNKNHTCDINRFSQRMLAVNPNNASAKSLQALYHLNFNDEISALDSMETIKPDDQFISFHKHISKAILIELNNNDVLIEESPDNNTLSKTAKKYTQAFGEAASTILPFQDIESCKKYVIESPQKERWAKACTNLGKARTKGDNVLDIALGYAIQQIAIETLPNSKENRELLETTDNKRAELMNLLGQQGKLLQENDPDYESKLELYMNDYFNYGEVTAIEKLIERERNHN